MVLESQLSTKGSCCHSSGLVVPACVLRHPGVETDGGMEGDLDKHGGGAAQRSGE